MKKLLLPILAFAFVGCNCSSSSKPSDMYITKTKEWGATSNFYCDARSGFMMKEYFWYKSDITPRRKFVEYDNGDPVACKDTHDRDKVGL